ncbi:hypothetical protein ACWEOE_10640 [Amycolatopsis sp. NPDC004368]
MSDRRKKVGELIKRGRRAAGYKSAKAYAQHLGISPTSVTRAENGWDTTGAGVYSDIERDLGWAPNSIMDYVEERTDALPAGGQVDEAPRQEGGPLVFTPTPKDIERWRRMTPEQITEEGEMIGRTISADMRVLYLQAAFAATRAGSVNAERL